MWHVTFSQNFVHKTYFWLIIEIVYYNLWIFQAFYTLMTDEYGIPEWGCYVIFALLTIVTGLLLGLVSIPYINLLCPWIFIMDCSCFQLRMPSCHVSGKSDLLERKWLYTVEINRLVLILGKISGEHIVGALSVRPSVRLSVRYLVQSITWKPLEIICLNFIQW
jgi:hypothetical protein